MNFLRFFQKQPRTQGLVGLAPGADGLALAWVSPAARAPLPKLEACRVLPGGADAARALKAAVEELGLAGAACNYTLPSTDYQVLLVEAPKVQPHELTAAVRWKIKDLVDLPLEQLGIDLFPLPPDAYRSQGAMLYVVAANKSRLIQARDLVLDAGLQLQAIDIPELCLLNLSRLPEADQNGLAVLEFGPAGATLNLSRQGAIYLTRRLSTQIQSGMIDAPDWVDVKERLVLEIQRSLDFFESQMGQGQIPRLLIVPCEDGRRFAQELNAEMAVKVELLDPAELLFIPDQLADTTLFGALRAVGAALRQDEAMARAVA